MLVNKLLGNFAKVKKFLVTIFAFLYLVISSGFTVQVHYCMDKLSGWELSLISDKQQSCERCGMHMVAENDCCKNEQKVVKFESDQKAQQQQNFIFQPIALVQSLPETNFAIGSLISIQFLPGNLLQKPPNLSMPLFVRHQNFRI